MNKVEALKRMPSREDIEHISRTYFYQKTLHRKNKYLTRKLKRALFLAPMVFAFALSAAAVFLFFQTSYTKFVMQKTLNAKLVKIFCDGRVNRDIVKNIAFRGCAKAKSGISNGIAVLDSPRKYDWADAAFDFRFPIDLSGRTLSAALKGRMGGERINLVLRDTDNRTYRINNICLSSGWDEKAIAFRAVKDNIDISRINHIRFEYAYIGESSADSQVGVTVYIKNVRLTKET